MQFKQYFVQALQKKVSPFKEDSTTAIPSNVDIETVTVHFLSDVFSLKSFAWKTVQTIEYTTILSI